MTGSNSGRSRQPQRTRRSHLPNTLRTPLPPKSSKGENQNTTFSMTHTPQSPASTATLPAPRTAAPTPHQTTNSLNARVGGSRGAEPPGRSRAAAVGRRPCCEDVGATNHHRIDLAAKAEVSALRGFPGAGACALQAEL